MAKIWTKKEELYIRLHYLKETNAELAKRFKTTPKSAEKKLYRLGLKRRGKKSRVAEEKRKKRIENFLREKRSPGEEKGIDEDRSRAIAQFDVAIKLYYAKKYRKAEKAFEKISKEFSNFNDLVYKAEQYIRFCLDKK